MSESNNTASVADQPPPDAATSLNTFYSSLTFNSVLSVSLFMLFIILRPRFPSVYMPKPLKLIDNVQEEAEDAEDNQDKQDTKKTLQSQGIRRNKAVRLLEKSIAL